MARRVSRRHPVHVHVDPQPPRSTQRGKRLFQQLTAPTKHRTKRHAATAAERRRRRAEVYRRYDTSARGRYKAQKYQAKKRGIPWELTFTQWVRIWVASGKWNKRGNTTADGYVMMRPGDVGPYAVGNVKIGTHRANIIERNRLMKLRRQQEENERPDDWYEREREGSEPGEVDEFDETPF